MYIGGGGAIPVKGDSVLEAMKQAAQTNAKDRIALQEETSEDLRARFTDTENPFAATRNRQRKTLSERTRATRKESSSALKDKEEDAERSSSRFVREKAEKFEKQNSELKGRMLELLRSYIKPGDSREDVLRKAEEFYHDISLVDEALDFLLETTEGGLKEEVSKAKQDINERFQREISAGKNIGNLARSFSEKGLGDPSALRKMYRDITGNPRDPRTLFEQLTKQFPYKKLQTVIKFLFHSIGTDLRAKGSSIPHGLLHRLITETRTLQMILGIYRFFSRRMNLINMLFDRNGLVSPPQITFENLAKLFMQLTGDRYPSSDRILRLAKLLGIDDKVMAKIIIFSQFRDGINEVDGSKIFRSIQHRYEVLQAIIEALEELEDDLELLEEEQEQESKLKRKEKDE